MRITITDIADNVEVRCEKQVFDKEDATFDQVFMRLMVALESVTTHMLDNIEVPDPKAFREHMYDMIDDSFGKLLKKCFPEIDVSQFDLTAAAVVYAQDQIIQKAEAEGKTYEEMLDEYNDLANKYINEKRLN